MSKGSSIAQRLSDNDLVQEGILPYIGAVNGEPFLLKQKGETVEAITFEASLPVFKSFGLAADKRRLLYTALKNGIPSGELYVEDLHTGELRKLSSRLVMEAAWSPANDNEVAYTFATGKGFGVAVVEVDSGKIRVLSADGALADIIGWDDSGQGVYYFQTSTEYRYTRLTPRYISATDHVSARGAAADMSAGFPVIKETIAPDPLSQSLTQGEKSLPAKMYSFQISSPGGGYQVSGSNLLGSGELFARDLSSGASTRIGQGRVLKVLDGGVVVRNFTSTGSKSEFISWSGQVTNIGTTMVVNYNLPLKNALVTQGGIGYAAPGNCNLISHVGTPHSFAYDLQGAVGEHVLASADGLVVFTVSSVTCNTLDTNGCADYVPNCNQGTYLGNVVIIQHADGSYTNYDHLDKSSVQVSVGANACQGLFVARQGHTGTTNGSFNGCGDHLHFQRQSSADIFGDSIAITFSDVASNPLACGSNYVSASTEFSYSVSPTALSFTSAAAGGTINVTANGPATCGWTATSNDGFITISSGSGSGNGTVTFTITDNPSPDSRTGTINVAGRTVTITQFGVGYINQPPAPNAGMDQTVILPMAANLSGSVSDEGLPNPPGAVAVNWTQVSGPGVATFADANALSTTASFSVEGQYVLRLTVDDGEFAGNDDIAVNVLPPFTGGALSGSLGAASSPVNLTSEGTLDWTHWGLVSASSFNRRSGVTAQLSNYTRIGGIGAKRFTGSAVLLSWSNGTPTASATNTSTGLYIHGVGNGFQLTAPADTTERTLRLHIGVAGARGRLEASLSDGSAASYTDTGLVSSGDGTGMYVLVYRAASSGQQLTLRWTVESVTASWGNVTLQGASLQ
jgi:murein DD-endopeptidase MepM/ murein hydrolase activator NlpD